MVTIFVGKQKKSNTDFRTFLFTPFFFFFAKYVFVFPTQNCCIFCCFSFFIWSYFYFSHFFVFLTVASQYTWKVLSLGFCSFCYSGSPNYGFWSWERTTWKPCQSKTGYYLFILVCVFRWTRDLTYRSNNSAALKHKET